MNDQKQNTDVGDFTFLKGEQVQQLINDFGLTSEPEEVQAQFIAKLGENILARMAVQVLHILPEEKHEEFGQYMDKGDVQALQDFLQPHIPNFDVFVQKEVQTEIQETKQRMQEELSTSDEV